MIQPFTVNVPHTRYAEFFEPMLEGDEMRCEVSTWFNQHVSEEWLHGWFPMMFFDKPAWCVRHHYDNSLIFLFNRADRAALFKLTWL